MIIQSAIQGKVHISLDENLLTLKESLRDSGFKVTTFKPGTPDEELFHQMMQTFVLTKNVDDFKVEAVIYDFDIIDIRQIKFIDKEKTRTNETSKKIASAIRESGITHKKGYFQLIIKADGSWDLVQLV